MMVVEGSSNKRGRKRRKTASDSRGQLFREGRAVASAGAEKGRGNQTGKAT